MDEFETITKEEQVEAAAASVSGPNYTNTPYLTSLAENQGSYLASG